MKLAANLEFAKSSNLSVEDAIRTAAEIGYSLVEPYVYTPIAQQINSHLKIVSETPYHHIHTETVDAAAIIKLLQETGVTFSAVDAHCTLMMPQIGVPYLYGAIDFAADVGCPIAMSDEGPLSLDWMDLDKAFDVMCFSLDAIVAHAKKRGVLYAMELHNALTAEPDYLVKLLDRFSPDEIGINFDTGNAFLAGNDPVDYLRRVADRVVHVHIKDIPESMLDLRGKVTGTRVGVAAGQGEIDLPGIVNALNEVNYTGALSVECDTVEEVTDSLKYLSKLIA